MILTLARVYVAFVCVCEFRNGCPKLGCPTRNQQVQVHAHFQLELARHT